ncbi:MAG: FliI/YscN family ATPase [Ilumatobacter sp.]|uniref:FliI/YscN family ATPase n=1 Tax=Ilumatobacter sp. TaxID=1967498 RepID=UPI002629668A|nr:FliI/YscN family ATPase [Ilumatobacter sp.]MDJ0767459.1 FliI/YscN family ATPase [Ilumatobacter sp.]
MNTFTTLHTPTPDHGAPRRAPLGQFRHERMRAHLDRARAVAGPQRSGSVRRIVGLSFDVAGLDVPIGASVEVIGGLTGEVVACGEREVTCMPYGDLRGLRVGARVISTGRPPTVSVGPELLGRIVDAFGEPLDDGPPLIGLEPVTLDGAPPHPLRRARVDEPLSLGVRAWDTLVPMGRGQRVGVFAGSGVGKSTLMGMVARGSAADVNVVALIGERGREVREFVEAELGEAGLARSVVVVATSDSPALIRLRAAMSATRIAEWFRDRGDDVVLMMDSLTRYCMAQREIGLSAGEPPTSRGYPPSVFTLLPKLLERAGTAERGSITGIYTVLVDGDDHNEPIADAARSILDGHVVLSRALAHANHYPAIDVLASVSRVAGAVTTADEQRIAAELRRLLAAHAESRDLIEIGAYVAGTNAVVDRAVDLKEAIDGFLRQPIDDGTPASDAFGRLGALLGATP